MNKQQERKIQNWVALHNSILSNIQDSTKELTSLLKQKEGMVAEMEDILKKKRSMSLDIDALGDDWHKTDEVVKLKKQVDGYYRRLREASIERNFIKGKDIRPTGRSYGLLFE